MTMQDSASTFRLGQEVRVKAEATVAYSDFWFKEYDDTEREWTRKVVPAEMEKCGWQCVHGAEKDELHVLFKRLWRRPFEVAQSGVVIGKTYRATGRYYQGYLGEDSDSLSEDKRHTVYEIATSLRVGARFFALPEDMEAMS